MQADQNGRMNRWIYEGPSTFRRLNGQTDGQTNKRVVTRIASIDLGNNNK